MPKLKTLALTLTIAIGAAALAGCGDDKESRTRAAFAADVNKLCTPMIETRGSLAASHFPSQDTAPTVEQLQAFYADFAAPMADLVASLKKIEPAKADRAKYDQVVKDSSDVADLIAKAGADSAATQRLLDTDEAALHTPDKLLKELGINPEC